jgi:hypothetical protein
VLNQVDIIKTQLTQHSIKNTHVSTQVVKAAFLILLDS